MDIEQLIYEAGRLHDATSLLNRQRARYMTLETIAPIGDNPIVGLPAVAT